MTYQEILEGITSHRLNLVQIKMDPYGQVVGDSLRKKIEEIEWALQAIAEKLAETERPATKPTKEQTEAVSRAIAKSLEEAGDWAKTAEAAIAAYVAAAESVETEMAGQKP